MSTSDYYKKNPAARKRRNTQQKRYNKKGEAKGNKISRESNRANRSLGTYGNGDGKDAAHTSKNRAKLQSPSVNRANPRKGKKYSSGKGRKIA